MGKVIKLIVIVAVIAIVLYFVSGSQTAESLIGVAVGIVVAFVAWKIVRRLF